jgi:EAL and modified HD-GYP domain-containing signal transduction protein
LRDPLIAAHGGIAGGVFRFSSALKQRLRVRADPITQAAHALALLASMRPTVAAGRVAMTSLPYAILARPAVLEAASGACIVLDPAPGSGDASAAEFASLRGHKVRIGRIAPTPAAPAASQAAAQAVANTSDFLVLQRGPGGFDALAAQVSWWRGTRPDLPIVVTGVEGLDELERTLSLDVWLASAQLQTASGTGTRRPLRPAVTHICQLLAQLRDNRHVGAVSRQLGADVALSYRLLRYINSPAFGLSRSVASIEEAVLLIGYAGLYRWLSIALLDSADGRKASRALQEVSLARARFLELLASERAGDPPQALFTVGLLSLLEVLLQAPLGEILAPLHLEDNARQALLEGRGPWLDYLALAQDLEANQLDLAAARADRFGGLESVLRKFEVAWVWATGVTQGLHA